MADRSSIKSIIDVLQTNLEQLIKPDVDSITEDDLELIASMCDQIVDSLKSSFFFLKRFNYYFSEDEKTRFNEILTDIDKKLSLIDDQFMPDSGTSIYPLYVMFSKLDNDEITDLELYFIVFSLAFHVHHEIERRNTNPSIENAQILGNNGVLYDPETDTFSIPTISRKDEEEDIVLRLREPGGQRKTFNWLSLFSKT